MSDIYSLTSSVLPGTDTTSPMVWPTNPIISNPGTITDYQGNTSSTTVNTGDGSYTGGSTVPYATNTYTAPPPPPDPYAQWGGKAAYDALVSGFDTQKQGVLTSAGDAASAFGSKYGRNILDFLDQERLAQGDINTKATRNELAKRQGTQGIMGMVGRGIRSAGVMLANKNASDSSATGAIANAYGQIGRQQMSGVGQQYEQGNQDVADMQNRYAVGLQSGIRGLQGSKDDAINTIVGDASGKLSELDARMAAASLPERIALDQEKQRIRQDAITKLQQYDQQLTSGVAGINPSSIDERRQQAAQMMQAGTDLGADAFQYTDQAPLQFQNSLPGGASLPIYTMPRSRRTA